MKKIGVLTFHASHNCGSFLQSYAMQKSIQKLGYYTEIIDYSTPEQKNMYAVFKKNDSLKHIIRNLMIIPYKNKMFTMFDDYEKFIRKNLILTSKSYTKMEELKELNDKYDIFLCGSDQIWNIKCGDASDAYFLPFVNNKIKVAYAPSFGGKNIIKYADDIKKYQKYLEDFRYISVREENGKKWIKELTGKDVPVVLDPTLLLDINEYAKIEENSNIKGDYIFYYAPSYKEECNKVVDDISKKYNLPVVMWNTREWILKRMSRKKYILPEHQTPGIYLNLIKNAKLILTTSFHGTIFSTLYHKNYKVIKNGGMNGDDDRVKTLLMQLGFEDRFLIIDNYDINNIFENVDYSKFESKLDLLRKDSLEYLTKILESK